jgi:hypothetical protein
MNYQELIQTYFERSNALTWFWTVYILVIGGVLGFSTFRQRPELITTILVSILYVCFAYKNVGAIEATAQERQAVLLTIKAFPEVGTNASEIKRLRENLEPHMPEYDIKGALYFHYVCDLLTLAFLWAKEWRRRMVEPTTVSGVK